MSFVGNKKALNFIEKTLQRDATGQAYLFSGPESVGKFFLAKAFAKSLISGEKFVFDDEAEKNLLVDMIVVSPEVEEKKGITKECDITIEKVREARRELSLFPHNGKRKVLIVDNAHKMNITSQNAFLKILEEPNSTSVIILVTHEDSKILPTIKSRCQRINFSLVGKEAMMEMEGSVGKDFVEKYEALSMGRPGLLSRMAKEKEELDYYAGAYEECEKILASDINQKLSYAEKMSKDVNLILKTLSVWNWILRKSALEREEERDGLYVKISAIEKAMSSLKNTNANSRLVLENLLLNI